MLVVISIIMVLAGLILAVGVRARLCQAMSGMWTCGTRVRRTSCFSMGM
jgi:hypothetical protein